LLKACGQRTYVESNFPAALPANHTGRSKVKHGRNFRRDRRLAFSAAHDRHSDKSASQTIREGATTMCDYSPHYVHSRPAKNRRQISNHGIRKTVTRGFASVQEPDVAVCLRPATELTFGTEPECHRPLYPVAARRPTWQGPQQSCSLSTDKSGSYRCPSRRIGICRWNNCA